MPWILFYERFGNTQPPPPHGSIFVLAREQNRSAHLR